MTHEGDVRDPHAPSSPYCYRHPRRETYVSCQRCGRPICPDCMIPAAVGFQCPEEGKHTAPARGRGGERRAGRGRLVRAPGSSPGRPGVVTLLLIGLCVAGYAAQGAPNFLMGTSFYEVSDTVVDFQEDIGPVSRALILVDWEIIDGGYHRFIGSIFLSGDIWELLLGIWCLYFLAPLESIIGRIRYIALVLTCAVGSGAVWFLAFANPRYDLTTGEVTGMWTVGIAPTVFGLFVAYFLVARRLSAGASPLVASIVISIVLSLALTLSRHEGAVASVLGGLATGALAGIVLTRLPQLPVQGVLAGVFVAACLVATSVKASELAPDQSPQSQLPRRDTPVASAPLQPCMPSPEGIFQLTTTCNPPERESF